MKDVLRKEILRKREQLSPDAAQKMSRVIKKRLFELDEFQNAHTILFYISYDNEVFTHEMIKEAFSLEKHVVVPCTDNKNKCVVLSTLKKWDDLCIGAYNIFEPKKECKSEILLDSIDLILVPGVAFDLQGNRIGHGMGYYDRLLQNASQKTKIGLAFELQIVKTISNDKHDIRMDKIVTEKRIIPCV